MTSKELNDKLNELDGMDSIPDVPLPDSAGISVSHVGDVAIAAPSGHQSLVAMMKSMSVEASPDSMQDTGKRIFYWGWFWRTVDFDRQITLAWDESGVTGFCENNKWNYPMLTLSKEDSAELRRLCEEAVESPSIQKIAVVNGFMASKKPDMWLSLAQSCREEIDGLMKSIRKK